MFTNISELKLVLEAVSSARKAYEQAVSDKFDELILAHKPTTDEQMRKLYKMALTSNEAQAEYQKLINVYGIVGAQSTEFVAALSKAA